MSKVSISRQHSMDHDKLLAEVEELAQGLVKKYGGEYRWDGDQLTYDYSGGVTACVQCGSDDVQVEVKFGMLMSMLKGPISREIEEYLDKHLN